MSIVGEPFSTVYNNRTDLDKVRDFHSAFGLMVRTTPHLPKTEMNAFLDHFLQTLEVYNKYFKDVPNPDERILRVRLMVEEFTEYVKAEAEDNIVEIADALADMQYIGNGTAVAYGIPLDTIFSEVHDNNMTKLGSDGKPIVKNGKICKPENYKSVDLSKFFPE